ncbi:MAG: site-specific integrase [Acidobacteria bacterium]|nr:site-specific integrase [Acidobacteriota bacterium]
MSITLKRLVNQFLAWAEVALKPATVASYQHHLRRFVLVTKNKQVRSLRPMHLTRCQGSWHLWQAVQRMFNWAVDEAKIIRVNPFSRVRAPGRRQRKRILSPRELALFLRRSSRRARAFLLALRETFARPQEIRAVQWCDVQSESPAVPVEVALPAGRALFVLHEYKDRARRADDSAPRVLLISRRLGRLLLRLRRRARSAEGPVFLNSRGRPWTKNAVRCLMRRLRRRLGYARDERGEQVVAYTFRHSRATLAAASGIVDRVLADLLGHVETRTTARYQHLNVQHLREALKRMAKPACDRPGG